MLVGVVVFPVRKVANMAGVFNILRPLGVTRQDCIIYANGKQDNGYALRFFVQRFLDFVGTQALAIESEREPAATCQTGG